MVKLLSSGGSQAKDQVRWKDAEQEGPPEGTKGLAAAEGQRQERGRQECGVEMLTPCGPWPGRHFTQLYKWHL